MKKSEILLVVVDFLILLAIFIGIHQVEGENKIIMTAIFIVCCKITSIDQKLERWGRKK